MDGIEKVIGYDTEIVDKTEISKINGKMFCYEKKLIKNYYIIHVEMNML